MARAKVKLREPLGNRGTLNATSFVLTVLFLCLAVGLSNCGGGGGGGGFANSLDKITNNLKVAIDDLRGYMPNYTDYAETRLFQSEKVVFKPKGMAGLYNLTAIVMDFILPPDFLMRDLIIWRKGPYEYYPELNDKITVTEILKYYWPLILVVVILVLMTVLIPIVGLFFCCCRCCGNCGARTKPCDKRRDLCKKVIQGALLIVLGTALLFCVVCAFASNQQIQEGTDELPTHINNAYSDSGSFLDSASDQATNLLINNYREFTVVFKDTVQKSGVHVMQQLNIWSNATAMMDLYNFVEAIPAIIDQLKYLKDSTNHLRAMASQLNDAMRKVKRDLLTLLRNCTLDACVSIQKQIANLQTNIDFNRDLDRFFPRLPDVTPAMDVLGRLDLNLLKTAAEEGKSKLDNIEKQITSNLNDTLEQALVKVEEAGTKIKATLSNVTQVIFEIRREINYNNSSLNSGLAYLVEYSAYRYYGGLALSCILLLITIFIVLGLICGICGKRPDGYSDNCCNKGAGGQFLMCAVMLIFLFSFVIGVVTLGTLLLGLASDRSVCYPLRHPDNSVVIDTIDDYLLKTLRLHNRNDGVEIQLSSALKMCYKNESLYNVLNLEKRFNIDNLSKQFNVDSILDTIENQLDRIVDPKFTILNNTNINILRNLSRFDPGINFDHFQDELRENFTSMSLNQLSDTLQRIVDQMDNNPMYYSLQSGLKLSILHVNTYDEKLLAPMRYKAREAMDIALSLDSKIKMNASSFPEAIHNLVSEIEEAQHKLREDGSKMLIDAATSFGDIVKDQVQSYIQRVVTEAKYKLGKCDPLNVAINATLTSTCDKIIKPWNGFWVSMFASLLLFIPTLIVSVKLSSLYQKYKQYGQYVETEYLYDVYADRGDSVPLHSRSSSKSRGNKKKKGKRVEDRHQMSEVAPAASQSSDTRYADMAPKQWEEFPNGGPPQYQRAPTEYERPPPYYYPGTAQQ
ncbi:unnamed protein product [Phyllotreta striolata]|uniref:Prominin-like protein n=1 Tax=Phyllotreta striolata TaxID=444603 RepID=A0A9P0DYN9_PHYSR|nr:unnamed protein product [Phyllotreta striolata]